MKKISIRQKLFLTLFLILFSGTLIRPREARADSKLLELLFNEGAGTILNDSSGLGNNANIIGATWTQLPTGKWALNFNGTGNRVSCSYSSSLDLAGINARVTLEAWVNMTQNKSAMWTGTGSGGSGGGYALYYHQPTGKVAGYVEGVGAATSSTYGWKALVYETTPLELNRWYHVVYTYDGSVGKIYLNGVLSAQSGAWTGGMFANIYHTPFQIYSGFAGMFGKVSVYDYTLSPSQISNIYQSERGSYFQISSSSTIYVLPAITDTKTLSDTLLSSQYIGNNISLSGSPGEYRPANFAVYTPSGISSMTAAVSNLIGSSGTISSDSVDIRVVKIWYQAGEDIWVGSNKRKLLTPELLLKDDSLVKIENQENYLKLTSGNYVWISQIATSTSLIINTVNELPVQDSSVLLPVNIPAGTNKQFWITVKIPDNATAGTYNGTIQLNSPSGQVGTLQIGLTVLPITLSNSYLEYSIYYRGRLNTSWPQGSISSEWKSEAQLEAEMKNMFEHGVTNPNVYQSFNTTLLGKVLTMRNNLGMGNKPLYYLGFYSLGSQATSQISQVLSFAKGYGVPNVYFYGIDEARGDALTAQRPTWQGVQSVGGKMFVAGYTAEQAPPGNFALVGDLLDLLVCAGAPSSTEAAKWHSIGHKIFNYANPQVGEEKPETYRRNYGLLLWQKDFDGAMDYAYQHSYNNAWNDYDNETYREHIFAYPTINGVIDTIQWEGFREGVNDVRYLSTLLDRIKTAKASGANTSAAESWLANLKKSDLKTSNLDSIRTSIINYILSLQNQTPSCNDCGLGAPTVSPLGPVANTSFTLTCPANASGYDCIDGYANGSSNQCTFGSYSGNNVIFNCSGLAAGTYTSRCLSKTGTSRNCCSSVKTGSYTVQVAPDTTPPSQITNLSASNITQSSATLSWTAPGDDGAVGTASLYDIRFSTTAINDSNWVSATQATGEPTSLVSGTGQSFAVSGLAAATRYYFAIKAADESGNASLLSNVVSATTVAQTLSVSLTASPNSGYAPLNKVDLTAVVSGTAQGTVNYTLYCNRLDSGTNITQPYDLKYDNQTLDTKTGVDVCNYANIGSYTAKVIVERGGLQAENRTTISVVPSTAPVIDLKANGLDGPLTLEYNTVATLSWTSTNASSCAASASWSGTKTTSGAQTTGILTASQTYTISCTGPGGSASDSLTITVNAPTVSLPTGGTAGTTTTPTTPITPTASTSISELQAMVQQLLAQIAALQAQLAASGANPTTSSVSSVPSQFKFNNPLWLGLRNNEITYLQTFLKEQGAAIYPEAKITGYFGLLTRKAVIRFQLKYQIIQYETSPGAGLVGIKTRARINQILGR